MNIPDDVRKCVVFVAIEKADGSRPFIGSAFLISRRIGQTEQHFGYTVTARHVIEKAKNLGLASVFLRVNWPDGTSKWMEVPINEWYFHPTDASVDVAVYRGGPDPAADHLVYPLARVLEPAQFDQEDIGIGHEVAIVGLFANHTGELRNIPIVRTGNIAALPEEPVATKYGKVEAMLVEARSIGGLSGSPVFSNHGVVRVVNGAVQVAAQGPVFRLIGLVHGHFDVQLAGDDEEDEEEIEARINMGIAVVIAGSKVKEVISQLAIAQDEAAIEQEVMARYLAQQGTPPAGAV